MKEYPIIAIQNVNHYFCQGLLRKQILFDSNLQVFKWGSIRKASISVCS